MYSFNLYYLKGKDRIFSNFLLRQTHDNSNFLFNSNPRDIIPITFNMHSTLYENYYKTETKERYLVQTRLQN